MRVGEDTDPYTGTTRRRPDLPKRTCANLRTTLPRELPVQQKLCAHLANTFPKHA